MKVHGERDRRKCFGGFEFHIFVAEAYKISEILPLYRERFGAEILCMLCFVHLSVMCSERCVLDGR